MTNEERELKVLLKFVAALSKALNASVSMSASARSDPDWRSSKESREQLTLAIAKLIAVIDRVRGEV